MTDRGAPDPDSRAAVSPARPDARLLIWRVGAVFERQKGAAMRRDWTVLRFKPPFRGVVGSDRLHDVTRDLPYPDGRFEAVYARRILEHLTPAEADGFLREVHRVLQPGGVVRLSVPDLEEIVRTYLEVVEEHTAAPSAETLQRHREIVLELVDQMVRLRTGGLLAEEIAGGWFDRTRLKRRYGDCLDDFSAGNRPTRRAKSARGLPSFGRRLGWRDPRRSREANRWMHDRLSLRLLLADRGFDDISVQTHARSAIPGWHDWRFDTSENGAYAFEPSLYVEGRRRLTAGDASARDAEAARR